MIFKLWPESQTQTESQEESILGRENRKNKSLSGKELASSEKVTYGLEQCFSTVRQALVENDNPKTLPMIQRESDLELRLPLTSSVLSRLRDSGCGNTCNTYGTYLDTLHSEENSGLKYSEKAKT